MMYRRNSSREGSLPTHGNSSTSSSLGSTSGSNYNLPSYPATTNHRRHSNTTTTTNSSGITPQTFLPLLQKVFGIIALLFGMLYIRSNGQHKALFQRLNHASHAKQAISAFRELQRIQRDRQKELRLSARTVQLEYQDDVAKHQAEQDKWKNQREELRKKHEAVDKQGRTPQVRQEERDEAHEELLDRLRAAIRKESRRKVLERFGQGPFEIIIRWSDPLSSNPKEYHPLVLKTAPLDLVPHAIHLFLEQIAHGLWSNGNGNIYYRDDFGIYFGPTYTEEEEEREDHDTYIRKALRKFQELELDQLAVPDYHHSFPHLKGTVAMDGSPGGPDLYINTKDNTKAKGPSGSHNFHPLRADWADSCFAKVTHGLERLMEHAAKHEVYKEPNDWHDYMIHPMPIYSVEIVGFQLPKAALKQPPQNNTNTNVEQQQQKDPQPQQQQQQQAVPQDPQQKDQQQSVQQLNFEGQEQQ